MMTNIVRQKSSNTKVYGHRVNIKILWPIWNVEKHSIEPKQVMTHEANQVRIIAYKTVSRVELYN